ncbi:hypothetical protein [Streptomyces lasalocidi]|uniref:Uncharacterized protein n=1 Tax=Streptomyces lasalocidi TaxID=324833 RepID=A0A4U5WB41_STRLS|nr:hypothetical protein [Streptomyces lasalocidi]TKS98689.1 hypothetical protein E4U91_00020 [Streptomyces lasalocidi]
MDGEEPSGTYRGGPAGRLVLGEEAVAPWGPACPACAAARTGRLVPARRYLAPQERVCAGHRYWLLYLPATRGLPVSLGRCPDVIAALRQHVRLLRRSPAAAQAFEVARAVTGSWWERPWPSQEQRWPTRLEATRPDDAAPDWWKAAARCTSAPLTARADTDPPHHIAAFSTTSTSDRAGDPTWYTASAIATAAGPS